MITGAARGIGRAIALCFAREGCNIAFTDIALTDEVRATEAELLALGVRAKAYASDASDFDDAHTIVNQVVADFGAIDILVNNAGITRDALLLRMSEQQWDDVIRVNLKSAFNYTHAVVPVMMRARKGSIISLASVVGIAGNPAQANYAASKAGIIALMKSTAKELGASASCRHTRRSRTGRPLPRLRHVLLRLRPSPLHRWCHGVESSLSNISSLSDREIVAAYRYS